MVVRNIVCSVSTLAVIAVAMGCATADAGEEATGSVSDAYVAPWMPCPSNGHTPAKFGAWTDRSNEDCADNGVPARFTQTDVISAKKRAQRYFRYIMGGPAVWPSDLDLGAIDPTGIESQKFSTELCELRYAISRDIVHVRPAGTVQGGVCGLATTVFTLTTDPGGGIAHGVPGCPTAYGTTLGNSLNNYVQMLSRHVSARAGWCTGSAHNPIFLKISQDWDENTADFDPGPARLNNGSSLSAANASAASASYDDGTDVAATAYKFPPAPSFAWCGNADGGEPCNTGATAPGSVIYGVVQRMGNMCRCIL